MKLLDLYCGAGGSAWGYHQAGFDDITGVDIRNQPRYPFKFVRAHALTFLARYGQEYDLVHASPPCQAFSVTKSLTNHDHPDLVSATREELTRQGRLYVLENVPGAPLVNPIMLCGRMFGLNLYRHRLFESNLILPQPEHPAHGLVLTKLGRAPKPGEVMSVVGNFIGAGYGRLIMGIDWMTAKELSQAIPPAYTKFIGSTLYDLVRATLYDLTHTCI